MLLNEDYFENGLSDDAFTGSPDNEQEIRKDFAYTLVVSFVCTRTSNGITELIKRTTELIDFYADETSVPIFVDTNSFYFAVRENSDYESIFQSDDCADKVYNDTLGREVYVCTKYDGTEYDSTPIINLVIHFNMESKVTVRSLWRMMKQFSQLHGFLTDVVAFCPFVVKYHVWAFAEVMKLNEEHYWLGNYA